MTMSGPTLRAWYGDLARAVKREVSPGRGFALLMRLEDGQYHYASSAERADVRQTLDEWLARAGVVNSRDSREGPAQVTDRLALEGRCSELGRRLSARGHQLVLFLFDFGDRGSLAWFTNIPGGAQAVVRAFLDTTEELKPE